MKRVRQPIESASSPEAPVEPVTFEGDGVYVVRKIPTLFQRDWDGNKLVTQEVNPACRWVADGEGIATEKIDGTPILVHRGELYKRYDAKPGRTPPDGFFPTDVVDATTGRVLGFVPVTDGPEDRWVNEAYKYEQEHGNLPIIDGERRPSDGTYELVGPKVNGNPHRLSVHRLIPHGLVELSGVPRDYAGLKAYLETANIEGIVWHHDDGRMAKIKSRDFGIAWPR